MIRIRLEVHVAETTHGADDSERVPVGVDVDRLPESVDLANRLVQDNQSRVEIGTLAPIDVVSAQAEAASRRNTLVQSQATVRTADLAL